MQIQTTLIVGANSEIAKAIALQVLKSAHKQLIIVSRDTQFYKHPQFHDTNLIKGKDYHEQTINSVVKRVQEVETLYINNVFICHGLLHNHDIQPGTTDSPLSKPFHKNVPANKLFKSEFVAQQLIDIVRNTAIDGQASFVDWQGKSIPW